MSDGVNISRRNFLKIATGTAGGLVVSIVGLDTIGAEGVTASSPETNVGPFVRIESDGSIVIGARGCEIGQGVKTSLPMLLAEELDVEWSQIRVEQLGYGYYESAKGPANRYGPQGAGGSSSIPHAWRDLRKAGALARWLLVQAAATQWGLDAGALRTEAGQVVAPDGRKLAYGALGNAAARIPAPATAPEPKPAGTFRILGKPVRVVDGVEIVTGRAKFGLDEYMPGALFAVIARCPFLDGEIESVDDSEARKLAGVKDVFVLPGPRLGEPLEGMLAAGVAVVADSTWTALQARKKLRINWTPGPWNNESTDKLRADALHKLAGNDGAVSVFKQGDFTQARGRAARVIEASYEMPFLAHATMEPPNALIELNAQGASLVASLQSPGDASLAIKAVTGISRKDISIRMTRSGGGFGRRLRNDFVTEAAMIAKRAGAPIKLVWTREDDIGHDFYRPFGIHRMTAALDKDGALLGWSHRCAATPRNYRDLDMKDDPIYIGCIEPNDFPAYLIENVEKDFSPVASGMPRGWWRGPIHTFHAFAVQSFVDEIAHATGQDAVELRLALLRKRDKIQAIDPDDAPFETARLAAVLERCAELLGWGRNSRTGLGIACHFTFGGYAAHGFDVDWQGGKNGGRLVIKRAICVVDVGTVINPLGLEAQMMGATIDGLSTALNLQITVKDGKVQQSNFHDYPILRMADAPKKVEIRIMRSSVAPSGAGEIGIPGVAPALANALFSATGKRRRRLPLLAEQES
jgi:isoquinoline 1-oxidoreductase beta subunit